MNKELEEAIKTMQHWIEYEKENKEKIYKADELIKIQETVLKELKRLQEDYIEKDKIREKIEEMQEEYNKLDKQVDEYINDSKVDLNKYYENKEKISTMQTISWAIGKIEELLKGE